MNSNFKVDHRLLICIALTSAVLLGSLLHAKDKPAAREVTAWQKDSKPTARATRLVADLPGFKPSVTTPLSEYGGWEGTPLKATGFFRTEKIACRWWFVDPQGFRYLSAAISSVYTRGMSAPAKAAFDAKYKSEAAWRDATIDLLSQNGINGTGSWSADKELAGGTQRLPSTRVWNFMSSYGKRRGGTTSEPGHTGYPNKCLFAFDPDFETFCDEHAKQLTAVKDDPYLVGHFSDNELPFPLDSLDRFLQLPETDAGRVRAETFLKERKLDRTRITDEERQAWMDVLAERYFSVVANAIRKYDPNHLFLGSRFYGTDGRNAALFRAAGRHVDVVSFNLYGVWTPRVEMFENWETLSGRPTLITEFYAKGEDSGLGNAGGAGWTVKTQQDRGSFYQTFTLGLLESKSCVGWHWLRYRDNDSEEKGAEPAKLVANKGIVSRAFVPYMPLLDSMKELNQQIYPLTTYFDGVEK